MADVVLVQPKVGDWDQVRSHPSLPLGLLSASRLVAKEFDTVLIDTRIDKNWKKRLREELNKQPVCVGITSTTGIQIGYALEISHFVKNISKVPVVWGGVHCSLLPESTIESEDIDILVIGDGEITFLELVQALANKSELGGIQGIWYKVGVKTIKNPRRSFVNLDDLPDLPLTLIPIERYLPIFKGRRTFYIETSRGCNNQCGFCWNASYNNSWRAFSADRVIKDLKYLSNKLDIRSFYVVDDNAFINLERILSIAQGIVDEQLDIFLEIQGITVNSALKMDEKDLRLLVNAGVKKVHFGVESASERMLRLVNKKIEISDVIKINRMWSKHDIIVQYNFMCGLPGESIEDIRMTIDLAFQLMKENPNAIISPICPYIPYPGTPLYQKAIENGFVQKRKLEDWQRIDFRDDHWRPQERQKLLSSLFFASMFLDKHRSKDMFQSSILKVLIELYHPIAKFRVKHLFFKFMLETKIKELIVR